MASERVGSSILKQPLTLRTEVKYTLTASVLILILMKGIVSSYHKAFGDFIIGL